jgi:signal transduction histidine kinase
MTGTEEITRDRLLLLVQGLVVLPTLALIALGVAQDPRMITWQLAGLTVLVALVELLPVPAWRGLSLSVGLPLLLMIGMLSPPAATGVAALLGASDPREFKGQVSLSQAAFNRCQIALSAMAASWTFHAVASLEEPRSPALVLVLAATLASIADYAVNTGIVTAFMSIKLRLSPVSVARELRIGRLGEFIISYLGLGLLGLALAVLIQDKNWWVLPIAIAPLVFARQMFFRSQALEEAHTELQDREQVLKTLSNAMAEERADERLQIAGYLHDDLAQVLFRLSIQVDVARKLLEKDDIPAVRDQLEKIRVSKQETSDRIRALIRDLHRSPLGAKGLAEAVESFTDEVGRDADVTYHRDIQEMPLPAPIALLIFHISREAVMNSLKHAQASDFWISVREEGESIVLTLKDNGLGFDTSAPGPEGHFGMTMMRERAQVGGGTFDVQSAPGQGTTITVKFPSSLLQEEAPDQPVTGGAGVSLAADASPDTSGSTRGDDDFPRSVPA